MHHQKPRRGKNFKHTPPWRGWDHDPSHWSEFAKKQRGVFFLRFLGVFGLIVVLVLGGMAAFVILIAQLSEASGGRLASLIWISGCGLSLLLPLLAIGVAIGVFRGIATPIADVMSAAEAVAEGNLSVRVPSPKRGPSDFRRLADSFNHMIAELARLDQQRRNLTADVAHELRTPLHIIQGNLEGILDGVYEPKPEQINTLLDEIRILTRLVEDLQLLSTVEAGQLTLKIEPVDISELLTDISTSFSGQMEAAGLLLQVEVPENTGPIWINADPERLDQVISNLTANALKHTPEGGTITLAAHPFQNFIQIIVKDNGEGIPEEDLPFIFNRFWKGDRSRSRTASTGSGLGLAISRNLVQAHGGTIEVESKLGVGTTFKIKLPLN
jgi:two-component system OmpR family sensor kinase/two-component system sensor histidine kinase BaeS